MENSAVLEPWVHHRPYAFSGDSDAPSLLSGSISSVVSAAVGSPESPTSHPTPTRRESIADGRLPKKRKLQASNSKRSPVAYFTADPAHFRELVQRVTGATSTTAAAFPLYPPQAAGNFPLPTLDESSSLDPAGFVQPAVFGLDPALAEFDPLLFVSGSPTPELDLWGVV